jgi:hypothetical protein
MNIHFIGALLLKRLGFYGENMRGGGGCEAKEEGAELEEPEGAAFFQAVMRGRRRRRHVGATVEGLWGVCLWQVVALVMLGLLITFTVESHTPEVAAACGGAMWALILARVVCSGLEWMGRVAFVVLDVETPLRACLGEPPLRNDEEGGFCELCVGPGAWGTSCLLVFGLMYKLAFAIALTVVLPEAVVDRAPVPCLRALENASFTRSYVLAVAGWIYLVTDWIGACGYCILLLCGGSSGSSGSSNSSDADDNDDDDGAGGGVTIGLI